MSHLSRQLQTCLQLADDVGAGALRAALQSLAEGLLQCYAPGVDLWELLRRPAPGPSPSVRADAPLEAHQLGALVAERRRLCPPEARMWEPLLAYPPLAPWLRVMEALGCLTLTESPPDRTVRRDGRLAAYPHPTARPFLVGALRRLRDAWNVSFPGDPLPRPVSRELPPLQREWSQRARHSPVMRLRLEMAMQATTVGFVGWWREQARSQISWGQRLAFWSESEAKARERELKPLLKLEQARLRELWVCLWEEATRVSQTLPTLALRDSFVRVAQAVEAISAPRGDYYSPVDCTPLGQEEAVRRVRELSADFSRRWGVAGTFEDLLAGIRSGDPRVAMVRQHFADYQQLDNVARLAELQRQYEETHRAKLAVESRIGFWERINFLSQTPAKRDRNRLRGEESDLLDSVRGLRRDLMQLLRTVQPPAALYYGLAEVEAGVRGIRGRCTSRTEEKRHDDGSTTSETLYSCELLGLGEAKAALYGWGGEYYEAFGMLPGVCQLLELEERFPAPQG